MNLEKGQLFTGKYFTGKVEVLGINHEANELSVKLQSKVDATEDDYHWFEEWNLEHTIHGFNRGEYFNLNQPTRPPKEEKIVNVNGKEYIYQKAKQRLVTPQTETINQILMNGGVIPYSRNIAPNEGFNEMPVEYLVEEFELIQQKKSTLSSARRKFIVDKFNKLFKEKLNV